MVGGVFAEDADVVEVLIAVGWRWVVVSANLVASTGDAGVDKAGLSVVVVAELGRAAVAPWFAFHVSGLWIVCSCTYCEGCARNGLEVLVGLVLVVGFRLWWSVGA